MKTRKGYKTISIGDQVVQVRVSYTGPNGYPPKLIVYLGDKKWIFPFDCTTDNLYSQIGGMQTRQPDVYNKPAIIRFLRRNGFGE